MHNVGAKDGLVFRGGNYRAMDLNPLAMRFYDRIKVGNDNGTL